MKHTTTVTLVEEPLTPDESSDRMKNQELAQIEDDLRTVFSAHIQHMKGHQSEVLLSIQEGQEAGRLIQLYLGTGSIGSNRLAALTLSDEATGISAQAAYAKKLLALHEKYPDPIENYAIACVELERLEEQLSLKDRSTRRAIDEPSTNETQLRDVKIKQAYHLLEETSNGIERIEKEYPFGQWRVDELDFFLSLGRKGFESYQRAVREREGR